MVGSRGQSDVAPGGVLLFTDFPTEPGMKRRFVEKTGRI
jgi:hypothetical protein